jgi:hypothetical protein
MTVQCARCHNHKFDPIPQKDYYQIQAVFYPAKPTDSKLAPKAEVETYNAEVKRVDALIAPIKKQITELEKPYREKIIADKRAKLPAYILTALQTPAEKRSEGQKLNVIQVEKSLVAEEKELKPALSEADLARRTELQAEIKKLEDGKPKPPAATLTVKEDGPKAPESHFLHRGSPAAGVCDAAGRADRGVVEAVEIPCPALPVRRPVTGVVGSPSGSPVREIPSRRA